MDAYSSVHSFKCTSVYITPLDGKDPARQTIGCLGTHFLERDVYLRLRELAIRDIEGHHIPWLIDHDDDLLAIEMSAVSRPFMLDSGGAYLDVPPGYDAETLERWARDKQDQFQENWPKALRILAALRFHGIHVADVNPGNIAFDEQADN